VDYDQNIRVRDSAEKHEEGGSLNGSSLGTKGSIHALSLSVDGQLKGTSKREATTHDPRANGTLKSRDYGHPGVHAKAEISQRKMDSKST
jgi:hypothetical protein